MVYLHALLNRHFFCAFVCMTMCVWMYACMCHMELLKLEICYLAVCLYIWVSLKQALHRFWRDYPGWCYSCGYCEETWYIWTRLWTHFRASRSFFIWNCTPIKSQNWRAHHGTLGCHSEQHSLGRHASSTQVHCFRGLAVTWVVAAVYCV